MIITDLTGTTWEFGSKLLAGYDTTFSYSINWSYVITCDEIENGSKTVFALYSDGKACWFPTKTNGAPFYITNKNAYYGYNKAPEVTTAYPNFQSFTVTFTGGQDATNADLIAWLEANATLVGEETTVITYLGATAEMKNGQTATIKCAGKKAVTDIVITPDFSVEIAYGDIINEAHKGQTATLKCAGKKMKHDVVVSTYLTISGTWLLNQNVDFSMLEGELIQGINGQMVNTYNYPFNKIRITPSRGTIEVYVTSSGYLTYKLVYSNGWMWNDTAIKFGDEPQKVTIDFYNWLTANATMQ